MAMPYYINLKLKMNHLKVIYKLQDIFLLLDLLIYLLHIMNYSLD